MAVSIRGLRRTVRKLRLRRKKTNQLCREEVKDSANELRELAVLMAPVKSKTLESAIVVEEGETNNLFKLQMAVIVDGSIVEKNQGNPNRTVSRYAEIIHNNLKPVSGATLNLGRLSTEKDSTGPVKVGGGFMERAHDELKPDIFKNIKEAVRRGLRF